MSDRYALIITFDAKSVHPWIIAYYNNFLLCPPAQKRAKSFSFVAIAPAPDASTTKYDSSVTKTDSTVHLWPHGSIADPFNEYENALSSLHTFRLFWFDADHSRKTNG